MDTVLIVNKTWVNLRSQNRTRKTGFGCASTGFACPILGPSILASSYFQYSPHTFGSVYYLSTQFLPKVVYILKVCPFLFPPLAPLQCWHLCGNHKQRPELSCSCDVCGHQIGARSLTASSANNMAKIAIMTLCWEQETRGQCLQQRSVTGGECWVLW